MHTSGAPHRHLLCETIDTPDSPESRPLPRQDKTVNMNNTHSTSSRLLLGFLLAAVLLGAGCAQTGQAKHGEPRVVHASARDNTMTVEFTDALDQTQNPAPEQFAVEIDGAPVTVNTVTVKGDAVVLQLRRWVSHDEQVQISFTNTDTAGMQLRTVDQTPINDFAGLGATTNTTNPIRILFMVLLGFFILFAVLFFCS